MLQRIPTQKDVSVGGFIVGQPGELCCHHHNQGYDYSLKTTLLVHSNLQGASVGGCICISVCETAAQQEVVLLRAVAEEEMVQQEKSRWWPMSRPGQAHGAAQRWQGGCPGMVWCGCWLTLSPKQGTAMLTCCHSVDHGPLSVPSIPLCCPGAILSPQALCQFTSFPSPQGEPVPPGPCSLSALPASVVQAL